jgi:predicted nucleic acid-binding protein
MSERKGLVLDANILLRAVFGRRVREILEKYEDEARFYTPDVCFEDAQKYIPVISKERRFDVDLGLWPCRGTSGPQPL